MSVGSRADSEEPSFNVGGDWMCRSSARRESVEAQERNSSFLSVVDLQPQSQGWQQQQQQQPQQPEALPTEDWVAAPAGLQHGDINTRSRPFLPAILSQSQVSNDGVPWRRSTSQDNVDASHHPSSSTPTAFSTQTALDAYYRPSPKLSGQGAAPESDQSESSSSLVKALKFMRDVSDVGLMQELSLRQPIASTSRIPSSEGSMHKGKSGAHSELSGASREGSVRRGVRGVTPSELTFTIPATGQQVAPSAMELPQSPPLQQQQQQQQNGLDSVLSSTWLLPPPSLVATPPQQQQPLLSAQPPQQQHAQGGTGSCTNSRAQASTPTEARASFDTHGHSSYDTPDMPPLTPMLDTFLLPKSKSQQRQQQQGQLGPGVGEESAGHLSGQGMSEPVAHEMGGAPEDWLLRSQSKPWVSVSSMGQHSGAEHSGTSHSRVNNTGDEAKSLPAGRYTRPPYMPGRVSEGACEFWVDVDSM
ncbi:hypothetical protein DUNSADRAFT_16837 [Dunaliella salina]|nr:hypothetical protein DUNSADRAFT_16837 [Dunaliella salina]|eukprot:KAF5828908.1 hypothetical protein DUNSADRAFT_16837 [Dunaliella salina]